MSKSFHNRNSVSPHPCHPFCLPGQAPHLPWQPPLFLHFHGVLPCFALFVSFHFMLLDSTYLCNHLSHSVRLPSLSLTPSRSIHVVTDARLFFFLLAENYIICVHIFFIHSSLDEHFGCFRILTVVRNAAVNVGMQRSL